MTYGNAEKQYEVHVANIFFAHSPEEAVIQMAEWLLFNANIAGYRVVGVDDDTDVFLDAEDVYSDHSCDICE